jgi:PKD domain/IPT/TIG domain
MRTRKGAFVTAVALLIGAGLLASCSSDSPTRPGDPTGGGGSGGGGTSTTFAITVNVGPGELLVGDTEGLLVTVTVRRNDTGQAPPDGSSVTVTTSRGSFNAANSGTVSQVLQLLNGSATLRFFGGDNAGTAVIQGRIDQSVGQAQVFIRTEAAFALGSVSPSSGDPGGGITATITGQGIETPVQVEFQTPGVNQTVVAQVVSASPSQIQLIVPPSVQSVGVGQTLLVNIVVTIGVGTVDQTSQTLNGAFAYALGGSLLRPVISTVTPQSGPNEGGTRVRILGDGFESPVQVLFGNGTNVDTFQGVEAVVESVTRTEIVAITPSAIGVGQDNRNSFVDLLVRNQRTGAAIIDQTAFRYGQSNIFISSIAPNEGTHLGGTRVTIFGSGFDEPVAVSFAGTAARGIISVTGTEIIAVTDGVEVTSCNDISGSTTVVNIETSDGASGAGFTYQVPRPLIEDVDPTSLPGAGGTSVTITGRNFEPPVRVLFGDGIGGNPTVSDDGRTITVFAPAFNGTFPTEDCDAAGLEGTRSVPVRVALRVINLLTTCDDSLSNVITYNPAGADATCTANDPTASFSFTVNGTVVTFQNNSSNATSFTWAFGDGTSSGAVNPTHDYAGAVPPGTTATFNVTLTAFNASGSDSQTRQVTVSAPAPPPPPP